MNNEISKYLYDIKSSIDSIEDFWGMNVILININLTACLKGLLKGNTKLSERH